MTTESIMAGALAHGDFLALAGVIIGLLLWSLRADNATTRRELREDVGALREEIANLRA